MARRKKAEQGQAPGPDPEPAGGQPARGSTADRLTKAGLALLAAVVAGGLALIFLVGVERVLLVIFRALGLLVTATALLLPLALWAGSDPERPGQNFAPLRLGVLGFAAAMMLFIGAREGLPGLNAVVARLICAPGYETLVAPSVVQGMGVADYLTTAAWFPYCTGSLGFYLPRYFTYFTATAGIYLLTVLLWFALDWPVGRLLAARGLRGLRFVATPLLFAAVLLALVQFPAPLELLARPLNHVFASGGSRPSLLHDAVQRDDLAALRERLDAGDRVDGFFLANNPPLHLALQLQRLAAARLLLEHGADVTVRDHNRGTALLYAASAGDLGLVTAVLERGADLDAVNNKGETALYRAAEAQHWDVLKLLLERGAQPAAGGEHGKSVLLAAAGQAPPEVAALLLERGAAANAKDDHGDTPLLLAAKNGRWKTLEQLVKHGAALGAQDRDGRTALHHVAGNAWSNKDEPGHSRGRGEAMALLLERGADVNAQDLEGETPLHLLLWVLSRRLSNGDWYARHPQNVELDLALVALLVRGGADQSLRNRFRQTPAQRIPSTPPGLERRLQRALRGAYGRAVGGQPAGRSGRDGRRRAPDARVQVQLFHETQHHGQLMVDPLHGLEVQQV